MVSMDRPETESRSHEFLLPHCSAWEALSPNKELNTGESIHPVHFYLYHAGTSSSLNTPAVPAKLLQSCPTLCNSMDCSPPGERLLLNHERGQDFGLQRRIQTRV